MRPCLASILVAVSLSGCAAAGRYEPAAAIAQAPPSVPSLHMGVNAPLAATEKPSKGPFCADT